MRSPQRFTEGWEALPRGRPCQALVGEVGSAEPTPSLGHLETVQSTVVEIHRWFYVKVYCSCKFFKAAVDACEPSVGEEEQSIFSVVFRSPSTHPLAVEGCHACLAVTLGDCHHLTCEAGRPPLVWEVQNVSIQEVWHFPRYRECFVEERLLAVRVLASPSVCGKPQLNS